MSTGHRTQVLVESGTDYRTLQQDLEDAGYDYEARAGHDLFPLNGEKTPFEIIIHEKFSGDLSTFIAEHTGGLARASPHARHT